MSETLRFGVDVLDALGAPIAVCRPVRAAGEIVELELVWVSEPLRNLEGMSAFIGATLSSMYPDLYEQGWLEDLIIAKATGRTSTVYRRSNRSNLSAFQMYEMAAAWAGDLVVINVKDLSTRRSSDADMIRSAAMLTEIVPNTAWLIRLNLPNQTLDFSTTALRAQFGGREVTLDEMVGDEDRAILMEWFATPLNARVATLSFRSRLDDGSHRWFEIRSEQIPGTLIEVNVVRDVDHMIRPQQASQALA
ncbi:MAG: hypothetical protein ACKOXM_08485, partial [Agromyces sp.]